MPKVSQRGDGMTQSPIRSLIPFARKAKEEGVHVYHLNIGQPDIKTPEAAIERLRSYDLPIIEYGASEGEMELREVVRDYYCKNVAQVELKNIYVTTGASEAILFTLFSCFESDEEIIIPEPFYANYIGFSHVSGVNLVPVDSTIETGFSLPSAKSFIEKITNKTKAIFLCNPGNPTGNLYSREELVEIAQLVKKYDLFLIVDEVYREFCYEEEFTSILSIDNLDAHVVVIDSISKVFSSCGSRIGFIVSRNQELMDNILKYAQLRLCPPMIGQHMATACFQDRSDYLLNVKEEYNRRRTYLYERLSKMDGVRCYLPKAAFYNMTELPVRDAKQFCIWLLKDFRLNGETIMMAPGAGFYMNEEKGRSQVRIAFVLGIPELTKAMNILEAALKEYTKIPANRKQLSYSYI
jgi:aspartate aminotransferase